MYLYQLFLESEGQTQKKKYGLVFLNLIEGHKQDNKQICAKDPPPPRSLPQKIPLVSHI